MASEASPERSQLLHPHPDPHLAGPDFRPTAPEPWTFHCSPAIPSSWPAPWGTARPAPPPPGLCSWQLCRPGLWSGGGPWHREKLAETRINEVETRAFGRPPDSTSQLTVLQAGWAGLSGKGWLEVLITLSMFVCVTQPPRCFPLHLSPPSAFIRIFQTVGGPRDMGWGLGQSSEWA